MGDYPIVDAIRFVLGVAALLLAAMVLRMAYIRTRAGTQMIHPAVYGSYALALVLMAALRIGHIGQEPTWDLWVAVVVVALGWYGILRKARLGAMPIPARWVRA